MKRDILHYIKSLFLYLSQTWKSAIWIASVSLVYFIVGNFSLTLIFQPEGIAAIWPPDGIFLSSILLTRRSVRPYLIVVLFFTDLIVELLAGIPPNVSVVYSFMLTCEAVLSTWLLIHFISEPITFEKVKEVLGFLLLSVIISNTLVSLVAAAAPYFFMGVPYWSSFKWWWLSDGIGNLLVTPFILSWTNMARNRLIAWNTKRMIEGVSLFTTMILSNYLAFEYFSGNLQFSFYLNFLTFPFLLWAALRFGVSGVTTASIIISAIAIRFTLAGDVLALFNSSKLESAMIVQIYLAIMSFSSLFLAAVVTERKKTTDALLENETKFRTLAAVSPVGIFRTDTNGNFIYMNERWKEIAGISSIQASGESWNSIIHPDDRKQVFDKWNESVRESKSFRMEYRLQRPEGTTAWVMDQSIPESDRNGEVIGYIGTITDITEIKRAEEALKKSEEKFRSIFEQSLTAIEIYDRAGNLIDVNKSCLDIFGIKDIESIRGFRLFDDPNIKEEFKKKLENGENVEYESIFDFELVKKGNLYETTKSEKIYLDILIIPLKFEDREIYGYLIHVRDISQRKQMELEREQYFKFFMTSSDLMVIADPKGCFKKINPSCMQTLGYSETELLSKPFIDFVHPDDRQATLDEMAMQLQRGFSINFENRYRCKDGTFRWLSWRANYIKEEGVTYATARDITGRKQSEEEIRRLNAELEGRVIERTAQLEAANKELQAFSYSVSHDMRAPLRSIDGFSRALVEDYHDKLDETGKDYIDRVRRSVKNMTDLIEAMLSLSRLTRGEIKYEMVDLSDLARKISNDLKKSDPGRIAEFIIQEGIKAKGDARMLGAVLTNLLSNAWKFTGRHPSARIEFGIKMIEGNTVYFVRDDGAGFDKAYTEKLFVAFQRLHTEAEFPGIGIGLATVARIIHRHGGKVWAEGDVEKGATFFFTIDHVYIKRDEQYK